MTRRRFEMIRAAALEVGPGVPLDTEDIEEIVASVTSGACRCSRPWFNRSLVCVDCAVRRSMFGQQIAWRRWT